MSGLTEEQKLRIQENRKRALARLAEKRGLDTSSVKVSHHQIPGKETSDSGSRDTVSGVSVSGNRENRICPGANPVRTNDRQITADIRWNSNCGQPGNGQSERKSEASINPNTTKSSSHVAISSVTNLAVATSKKFYGTSSNHKLPVNSNSQPKSVSTWQRPSKPNFALKQRQSAVPYTGSSSNGSAGVSVLNTLHLQKSSLLSGVKGRCVLCSREHFRVEAGFHTALVEVFKSLKTKQYDAANKMWSFKLEDYEALMQRLRGVRPEVDIEPLPPAVRTIFRPQFSGKYPSNDIPNADLSGVDPILEQSLMPFQRTGVSFGVWRKGRVLIADDMGLGKTIQAICLACYYRHEWPLLVVVPSSVRYDWAEQLRRWVPSLDPQSIVVVATGKDRCTSGSVVVISYDLMSRKIEELKQRHFDVIIMDESHLLKNTKTARTKAALPLLQSARRVILLSGTPALSRPSELYTQIIAVSPGLFKFRDYGVRYCDGKELPWGWDFSGCSNMGELQLLLEEKLMIRRLKKDVLSQLPSKLRRMVLLDPSSIKISKHLQKASSALNLENVKGMEKRGKLLDYFHETARAKVNAVRDYVLDLLDTGQKFLLFAHHQEMLDHIETALDNKMSGCHIRIDGKTASEQRKYLCDRFQSSDNTRVALLSITAANAGLNLTAASLVVFAELFWNPGILVQAEDRVHRIGQLDSVNIHYLVATGTADDHIWPLVQNKLSVLSKAGLSKEDFSEVDTCRLQDSKQSDLRAYFEESFFEEADNQGEVIHDDLNTSPEKQTITSEVSFKKSPTKQTRIVQFFTQEPEVSSTDRNTVGGGDNTQCDIPEFEDCDWLDDVEWDESAGQQPVTKKLKL